MRPSLGVRRTAAVFALVLAVGIAIPRFLTHTPYQRLGITLDWRPGQDLPRVERIVGPPGMGLLRRGDVLRGLDGVVFRGREDLQEYLKKNGWPKGPFTLTIERDRRIEDILLPPVQLGAWQRLRLFLFPMAAAIASPLVALLLVWRRPDLGSAWAFMWFATLQGLSVIWGLYRHPQFQAEGSFHLYLEAYHALILWFPASYLHFMAVFPRPHWDRHGMLKSWWFRAVAVAYLVPLGLIAWGWPVGRTAEVPYMVFQSIVFPLGVLSLLGHYARPSRMDWRPTVGERVFAGLVGIVLLAAAALSALPEDPRWIAIYSMPAVRLAFTVVSVAWLFSPLLIAYLIANDPAFDPRRILARSLPYAVLTAVLGGLYLAIVLVAQRGFATVTGEQAMLVNVAAALVVAFAFAPARDRMQRWLDRMYGRDVHALHAVLDEAGRDLQRALDRGEVRNAVRQGLRRGLHRPVELQWPDGGGPVLADPEAVPDHARGAVENLLGQAAVRLENLTLQEQRAAAERRAVELREAATRAELRALQAQVQPHFLFNALNALSYLIETDPRAAQRFTERLADMLRYTVEAGERPAALLSEELEFVEDYLGVARERYESPLLFEYRGAPELLSTVVPRLLLQPLVENSLKHGCGVGREPLHLALDVRRDNGWTTLTFQDDGAKGPNGAPGLGVGLQNVEQRLRRFWGGEAEMRAGRRERGGFEVVLRWRTPKEAA